jgi:alpha-D-xyloside xylohydrolase
VNKHLAVGLLSAACVSQAMGSAGAVEKQADGVVVAVDGGMLRVQVWGEKSVRVTYAAGKEIPTASLSVVGKPVATMWTVKETDAAISVETPLLHTRIDKGSGAVGFFDAQNRPILQEAAHGREIVPAVQPGVEGSRIRQSFVLATDEGIYGLGQHQQGVWNYRGKAVRLQQQNMDVGIPVLLSSKGYMLLWDNPAVTEISVGAPKPAAMAPATARGNRSATPPPEGAGEDVVRWSSETGSVIDYYFTYGPTADEAMKGYRAITGEAPLMPQWMWGFFQCKERYRSQEELLGIAKKYRELKIPIDCVIQDWRYWPEGNNTWGSHQFDKGRYPDPAGMFKELHDMHFHTMISVWAKFDLGSANFDELEKNGGLYDKVVKYVFPPGQGKWYDPFNPKGREIYWKQMSEELFALGVDAWWLDAPEPEIPATEWRGYKTALGPAAKVFNAYPLMHSTGIYQGQRARTDEKRVVILTRSAYAGQQRNSAVTWSGDIGSTWQVLRNQIPAGLNFCSSGIPYWNTDIGGFNGRMDPQDPRYQELFARWFEFGSFCPMFRVHGGAPNGGTGPGKEVWRFDDKTQETLKNYITLRYRLIPYIYSTSWKVTSESYTMMRPLVMDFGGDAGVLNIGDQYMFGPGMMVCPVTRQGATTRNVYLPGNGDWHDFWTGKASKGGATVEAAAPVETMPLFVRAGAIVPMGPEIQYTGEKPEGPIEIRVYRGADGAFTLYEDQRDGYAYEKGAYATIPFTWNEKSKTLTIGARKGDFAGMVMERVLNVVFVGDGHGAGIPPTDAVDQTVTYKGEEVRVSAK